MNPQKTVSPKSALLHHNELEDYANVSLSENNKNDREERKQADHSELLHPSLTRKRHPVYGNSVFSEGRSIYRTGDEADEAAKFTDWLFELDPGKGPLSAATTSKEGRDIRAVLESEVQPPLNPLSTSLAYEDPTSISPPAIKPLTAAPSQRLGRKKSPSLKRSISTPNVRDRCGMFSSVYL